ncbi:MAG: F0F1 ATP synthase subunit gamma [Candidatus Eremiobacterota bacterium]
METLEVTRRRLTTARELHGLVRTVKVLSAVALRQNLNAARIQEDYRRVLVEAFQALLRLPGAPSLAGPVRPGTACLVALGTDQGLCGPFNEGVRATVLARPPTRLLVAGHRLEGSLVEAGLKPENVLGVPSSLAGVVPLVSQLVLHIESWSSHLTELTVDVLHQELKNGARHEPVRTRLLPLDPAWLAELARAPWRSRGLPAAHLPPDHLLGLLLRQWLFSELYRAVVQSMAAECQARLLAMQAAEKALGDRVAELERELQQLRQELVTDELLDLVAGFEAVTAAGRNDPSRSV